MTTSSHPLSVQDYRVLARATSVVAVIISCLVLLGWQFDVHVLKSLLPSAVPMQPNTALCFILSGSALWLLSTVGRRSSGTNPKRNVAGFIVPIVMIYIVALIGMITIGEYVLKINTGINTLLFAEALAATAAPVPGRMAPVTALIFVVFALSLLLVSTERRDGHRLSQYLALVVAFTGLAVMSGYIYGVKPLYYFSAYVAVALPTSILCIVLGIGALFARPDGGAIATITSPRIGGTMARRIIPLAVTLPIVIGWLRLQGEYQRLYNTEFGLALFATSNIVIFTVLVWLSARSLNRVEEGRNQAEEALRISERRFRALIERSTDAIVLVDRDLNILYYTPSVATIEGYTEDELIGRHADEAMHPDDLTMVQETFQKILANPGKPVPLLWRRRHKDGRWLWLEGIATNLLDDPAVGAVVTNYRDITQRKLAEEALRESEERFSKLFQSSPAGMALVRLADLRYVDANESWLATIGYSHEEVIGHTASELGVTFTEDREARIRRIKEAGGVFNEDVTLMTKQGELRHCLVSAQLVTMQSEPYLIGVYIDITDRVRAEEAQGQMEEQLRQSQKMESLGTLASGIAHDFNNILTAIIGNTKLARQDLSVEHPIQRNLSEIYRAGVRAADLVRRILMFSRQQESNRTPVKLHLLVEEAVELLRASLPAKIHIRTEFAPGVPSVSADAIQIHQVIMNLCTNAAYAMGEQGGLLEIRLDAVDVDADLVERTPTLRTGRYVQLTVSDTGCGMDQAQLQRIFEPFFTTKAHGEGTGLGLSVVHGIMMSHNGGIVVNSKPGKGTTFDLYFPAAKEAVTAATPAPAEVVHGQGEHVLYVDDEVAIVTLLTLTLERLGYQVTGYSNAITALHAFQAFPQNFDVVVTDLSMPGMSGLELASRLLELRPDIPIVLTSGYMSDAEIEAARHIGIRGFANKPTSIEDLDKTLRDLLDRKTSSTAA